MQPERYFMSTKVRVTGPLVGMIQTILGKSKKSVAATLGMVSTASTEI